MKLSDFDYKLPLKLIAQRPVSPRDHSKLLVLNRATRQIVHDHFYNIGNYLTSNDVLVFNQTKVFPARLRGYKDSGGKIEVLLTKIQGRQAEYIGRNIGRAKLLIFDQDLVAEVVGNHLIFNIESTQLMDKLSIIGQTPLPPYIRPTSGASEPKLRQNYQTVYATDIGSVAAPTAGFHFTKKLLKNLHKLGIQTEFVTLHVGLGTFLPVKTEQIEDHIMHSEWYEIKGPVAQRLKIAKSQGKRIVCVGTTSVRTLETWVNAGQPTGETDIFIYPGYHFKFVDAMITNFHLPKSTLLMLISAFADRELIMQTYQEAIKDKYRFYSFGDTMLII